MRIFRYQKEKRISSSTSSIHEENDGNESDALDSIFDNEFSDNEGHNEDDTNNVNVNDSNQKEKRTNFMMSSILDEHPATSNSSSQNKDISHKFIDCR